MYNVHAKILVYNKMDGDSIHFLEKGQSEISYNFIVPILPTLIIFEQ